MSAPTVERVHQWLDSRAMTRTMQAIAAVSLGVALLVGVKQVQYSHCLAQYNDRASAVATQRSEALKSTTDAVDKFIQAIAHSGSVPASQRVDAIRGAFENYLKTRAAADEQRKLNPLPDPPSETC